MSRRELIGLALVLLLALALRLINIGGRTLWYDEAFAVLFAEKGWDAMVDGTLTPVEGDAADVHPLLYYTTLDYWMEIFGDSPAAVRLYSALLGVASVLAAYGLAREWFGQRTAFTAGLITAVAPFHVQYSQETRMYMLLALALTVTTWVYWRALKRGRWGYWLLFAVLAGLSMYVQQLAAFYLMALGLLSLLARDRVRNRKQIIRTAVAAFGALLIYLPWLLYLPDQLGKLRQYWVQKPNILHFWLTLRSFVSVNLDFSPAWWLPTYLLAAVLTVFLLVRAKRVLKGRVGNMEEREALRWALWLAFMPMIFMWIASYLFQPVFLPRALLPSAVLFYIALAWLFTRGKMPIVMVGVLGAAWAVVIVFGLVTHYTWDTFPNSPFDQADDYLAREMRPGDVIVHANKITALPMIYYDRALPQRYVRDIPGSGSDTLAVPTQKALGLLADNCAAESANGADRVWLVTFKQLEDEMDRLVEDDPDNTRYDSLEWFDEHYQQVSKKSFHDLTIYLFARPDDAAIQAVCEPE